MIRKMVPITAMIARMARMMWEVEVLGLVVVGVGVVPATVVIFGSAMLDGFLIAVVVILL